MYRQLFFSSRQYFTFGSESRAINNIDNAKTLPGENTDEKVGIEPSRRKKNSFGVGKWKVSCCNDLGTVTKFRTLSHNAETKDFARPTSHPV